MGPDIFTGADEFTISDIPDLSNSSDCVCVFEELLTLRPRCRVRRIMDWRAECSHINEAGRHSEGRRECVSLIRNALSPM